MVFLGRRAELEQDTGVWQDEQQEPSQFAIRESRKGRWGQRSRPLLPVTAFLPNDNRGEILIDEGVQASRSFFIPSNCSFVISPAA